MKILLRTLSVWSVAAGCLASGCSTPVHHEKHTFIRMDMPVDVTVVTTLKGAALDPVWKRVDSLLAFWEEHYSQSAPNSEVKAINERKSDTVAVSRRLGSMIGQALAYSDTTAGSYDITVGPLKELWGLGERPSPQRVPPPDTLASVLSHIGFRHLKVNAGFDTIWFDDPRTKIDAGGFAKGFAMIETGRLLESMGFTSYLVSTGDIVSGGHRADGTAWRVGIQHPRKSDRLLATVALDSGAIFTSGDYERFWMNGDTRVHHLFNPFTGRSATNNQSVTIWSIDPLVSKFLSTGLFCKSADSIVAFVEKRPAECLVVDSAGNIHVSRGWQSKVKFIE